MSEVSTEALKEAIRRRLVATLGHIPLMAQARGGSWLCSIKALWTRLKRLCGQPSAKGIAARNPQSPN